MKRIILYSTQGCHLCDQALQMYYCCLESLPEGFELIQTDIAENDELFARYGVRIPVFQHPESGTELGWPFDPDAMQAFLKSG